MVSTHEELLEEIQRLQLQVSEMETQLKNSRQESDCVESLSKTHSVDLLRLPEEKYRILIENAGDAILVVQDAKLAFYNQKTAELTDYSFDALNQMSFVQLIHPDDRPLVQSRYIQRLSGEDVPDIYSFRAVKRRGEVFWVEIHAVRIVWEGRHAILCFLTDISNRKVTESNLEESEQRYRNIVELSPYGIVTLDTKGVIITCNSAFIALTGYAFDDFEGKHISRIPTIRMRDIPYFVRLFSKLVKTGWDQDINFAWTHKDGTERWGAARGVLLRRDEKVTGVQGIIRDITEQRRASQLLEALNRTSLAVERTTKSQEVFTVMGEELKKLKIDCTVFMMRDDGEYLFPAYVSFKRRAINLAERLVNQKLSNFQIEIAKVGVFKRAIFERETVLVGDAVKGAENFLPDNLKSIAKQLVSILDIQTSINAPLIIENQVKGLLSVQSDMFRDVDLPTITAFANLLAAALHKALLLEQAHKELEERRKAESEIMRLQRLLQNITDSMPSVLITLDLTGRVLTYNPAAETLLSRSINIQPGQLLWETDSAFGIYQHLFEQVLETRELVTRHHEPVTVDGTLIYQNIDAFPLVVDSLQGVVLRIDDVTEYVKLQELMLQTAKLASVGGLAAGVAHEINNPLAAMIQSAQMLKQSLDVADKRTINRLIEVGVDPTALEKYLSDRHIIEYIEGIREAGGRAAKIVSDLLAFSRKSPAKSRVDLNKVIETALNLSATDYDLSHRFDFRDIEIVRDLDAKLPKVVCDQQQIQQVIMNLVGNAAHALVTKLDDDGIFHPRISICSVAKPDVVQIVIEDNGEGIEESTLDHLFEPFYTTKDVGEGTGLGLWLSWSIITERHNGRIWADNLTEEGVRFTIELPVG